MNESVSDNQHLQRDHWQVTNDGVMGGLSKGKVEAHYNHILFSGEISTDNNGGFTSVFKRLPQLPDEVKSVSIRVTGDGNVYQLRVRSQVTGYELAYKVDFKTRVNITENITVQFADFQASFRGRIIDNAPTLNAENISHVGFLISAKQPGNFSLSIHAIDFHQ